MTEKIKKTGQNEPMTGFEIKKVRYKHTNRTSQQHRQKDIQTDRRRDTDIFTSTCEGNYSKWSN